MTKTFVIADLHGRYDLLQLALQRIEESQHTGGTVVFLGDYIDRGPQSKEILGRLIAGPLDGWEWITLKGNHEAMMVDGITGREEIEWWIGNGGAETLKSYDGKIPSEHLRWADKLPTIHVDAHRVYVHAGVDPSRALDRQQETSLLWKRYPANADVIYPGKHIVHGHTPHRHGPQLFPNRTNLDTGAVFYGRLVVGVFDNETPGGPVSFIEVSEHPTGR